MDRFFLLQDCYDLIRQIHQFLNQAIHLVFADMRAYLPEFQCQQVAGYQLRAVSFCRGYGDLRPCQRKEGIVRFPRDGRANDIDDRKWSSRPFLCFAQGCQRIRSLTRLADHDDQMRLIQYRVAISEFGRQFDPHRNFREILDDILRHKADMISRPAGDDIDLLDRIAENRRSVL